jgi:glycosyltransferase involved in cell wall biosynthesis
VRVLLVANTLPPTDVSGVGEQVLQLAAGLAAAGCEVRLLGRGRDGARGPKLLFPLTVLGPCRRALEQFDPDVVQVHESDGGLAAALVRRHRRRSPRPLLVALQQVSYVEERRAVRPLAHAGRTLGRPGGVERRFRWLKAPLQILLGRLSARLADLVLAPSRATALELARDYGARRVAVLPNVTGGLGIEAQPVPGLGAAEGYLLFVGRLRIRKGLEVAFEALARLRDEGRPAQLLIAGDGEHRLALVRRAAELGLGDEAVRFLGRTSAGEVRSLLGRAAALVVPSIYEGMPLVVLEAMAAGVPVVASRVSGIPEVVVDGETGWLVPPEDPPALASALAHALSDPVERARRGRTGRERCRERFAPERAARIWLEAVESARRTT